MLQKDFFQVQPFNPNPYWDGSILVNLSGSQKFEDNTVFLPGKYKIEVAAGLDSLTISKQGSASTTYTNQTVYVSQNEVITTPFVVRAYCGSNATGSTSPGINQYSGAFKVNAVDARTLSSSNRPTGVDVNHIFGAGGGNGYSYINNPITGAVWMYAGGGANCLGNGNVTIYGNQQTRSSGAGSCLHLIPVGGVFGTNYIRAYHVSPSGTSIMGGGAAFGGGATPQSNSDGWFTRGGNSPYGTGATTLYTAGNGIGAGKINMNGTGAYFNGYAWSNITTTSNVLTNGVLGPNSYIRITWVGPLD